MKDSFFASRKIYIYVLQECPRKSQNADAYFDTGGDKRREDSLSKAQIITFKLGGLPNYI